MDPALAAAGADAARAAAAGATAPAVVAGLDAHGGEATLDAHFACLDNYDARLGAGAWTRAGVEQ